MVPIPVDPSTVAGVLKDLTGLTERIMKTFRDRRMWLAIAAHHLEMFRRPEHPFRNTARLAALIARGHGILVPGPDPGAL